jgi:hypothetical protein
MVEEGQDIKYKTAGRGDPLNIKLKRLVDSSIQQHHIFLKCWLMLCKAYTDGVILCVFDVLIETDLCAV